MYTFINLMKQRYFESKELTDCIYFTNEIEFLIEFEYDVSIT